MKNFIAVGDRLTIPAPADIASGEGVLLETLFGVAEGAAASGAEVVLKLSGVFDLPKAPSPEWAILVIDNAKLTSRGRAVANVTRRRDGTSYTRLAGRQTIPVFILVPQVRLPKRLDLDRAARLWEGRLPELILANWPQNSGSSP